MTSLRANEEESVKEVYLESIQLIERLHRHFLEVVKAELDRLGIEDINNVQSLILWNIGKEELTVGELTHRGYYLGSNVSYNVKKMVENDYLIQARSSHDRRSVRLRGSEKGLALCDKIAEMYVRHESALQDTTISSENLADLNKTLHQLEQFWSGMLSFAPRSTMGISSAA